MKIGICSTDFAPTGIDELFRKISGHGFDAVQFSYVSIGMDEIPETIPGEVICAINDAAQKYGVEIVAVNATFNLIDSDHQRLARNLRAMDGMCRANRKLHCPLLTLCTGSRNSDSMWGWHPDNGTRQAWDELVQNLRPVVETAARYDMYLGVETEANNVVMTPQLARKLMDQMGYDRLKVILDCANLFWKGKAHRENVEPTIRDAFGQVGGDIVLAHGKDLADSDDLVFVPAGKGIVDFDLFLELLKQHGYTGAMVMHAIYDEAQMSGCVEFMRQKIKAHGLA